jgi:hypothetical protein
MPWRACTAAAIAREAMPSSRQHILLGLLLGWVRFKPGGSTGTWLAPGTDCCVARALAIAFGP